MVLTRQSTRASSMASQLQAITVETSTGSTCKPRKKRTKVSEDESQETTSSSKPKRARKLKPEVDKSEFLPRAQSQWKVGAHVSAAGGVENAVLNAASIGANSFALFLKSQRKWESPPLSNESITEFKRLMKELGYESRMVLPHGSYLINLGNPDAAKREKSFACFLDDLKRCEALGLELYNFHPGSTVGETSVETSLSLIADCINRAHVETSRVTVVLENMAGAGNIIGSDFGHLAGIIKLVKDKLRVGVCLDTCHAFAAGYDIRTKDGWNMTLTKFDEQIGLKYLCGMHLNDSKTEYNSKKDRHENIGLGHLGLLSFVHILNDPRTQNIPLILETPSFEQAKEIWGTEISVLQRVSGEGNVCHHNGTTKEGEHLVDIDALVNQLKKSVLNGAKRN
uniref:Apurinic-apyrimidinic endonuclease 1 n=1 Tax=Psilocybe cubensis TaxID=181762 RepID=A0A8H7Y1Y7_PSICU